MAEKLGYNGVWPSSWPSDVHIHFKGSPAPKNEKNGTFEGCFYPMHGVNVGHDLK